MDVDHGHRATVADGKETSGAWSEDVKEQALVRYTEVGPTAASRELGPDKSTITKWARAAGLPPFTSERTDAATRAASAKWEHRRAALANDFGDASCEALAASRAAIAEGRAGDARGYMITSAVAVDKADVLAGITANPVVGIVVDVSAAAADLARMLANVGALSEADARGYIDATSTEVDPR